VLLVEDEEPVRAFMQRVLERLGLDVLPAADGAEALRVLEVTAGRGPDRAPRLVILDLAIPAVEGAEVASIIRQRWPAIPIMVCSGSGDPKMLERASSPSIAAVLPKPFAPELLAAEVERVLRGGRG
jgi:CheY-like chemotaxis protein